MRPKLLLAADGSAARRDIERSLAREGIDVVVAGGGAEAMAAAELERPDIVLADIGMPDPDGFAVSAFIKGHPRLAAVPVVLLADAGEQLDERTAIVCDGVLTKPFEPQAAVRLIRDLLGSGAAGPASALPTGTDISEATPSQRTADIETDPLEAYFDRLDAAFAACAATAALPGDGGRAVARTPPGEQQAPAFANAFVSMFESESAHSAPPLAVPEEVIDEIVRRVVARLGEESMRRLVLDTAERIVREEIERIRQASGS